MRARGGAAGSCVTWTRRRGDSAVVTLSPDAVADPAVCSPPRRCDRGSALDGPCTQGRSKGQVPPAHAALLAPVPPSVQCSSGNASNRRSSATNAQSSERCSPGRHTEARCRPTRMFPMSGSRSVTSCFCDASAPGANGFRAGDDDLGWSGRSGKGPWDVKSITGRSVSDGLPATSFGNSDGESAAGVICWLFCWR